MSIEYWVEMVGQVERRLNDGWELYGNPFLSSDGCVLQAMTRKDEPTQPEQPTEFRRGQIVMVSDEDDIWKPDIFWKKCEITGRVLGLYHDWKYCRLPTQQELTGEL